MKLPKLLSSSELFLAIKSSHENVESFLNMRPQILSEIFLRIIFKKEKNHCFWSNIGQVESENI